MKRHIAKALPSLLVAGIVAAVGWVWRVEASRNEGARADDYLWRAVTDHEARLRAMERPSSRGMEAEADEEPPPDAEALRAEYEGGK